jgi:hypothetical protein
VRVCSSAPPDISRRACGANQEVLESGTRAPVRLALEVSAEMECAVGALMSQASVTLEPGRAVSEA